MFYKIEKFCFTPKVFWCSQPGEGYQEGGYDHHPGAGTQIQPEILEDVLEEGAAEDDDDTAGAEQGDGDTGGDEVPGADTGGLLCNDHVGVAALGGRGEFQPVSVSTSYESYFLPEFRPHPLHHHPAVAEPLPHEDRVEGEVEDEAEAGGSGADHGVGEGEDAHAGHLPGQQDHRHRDVQAAPLIGHGGHDDERCHKQQRCERQNKSILNQVHMKQKRNHNISVDKLMENLTESFIHLTGRLIYIYNHLFNARVVFP